MIKSVIENNKNVSVLIAMYRSQGLPARYAVGTVNVKATDVANWLGVHDTALAAAVMNDQGIQHVTGPDANGYIQFEHVWVEVQLPYHNYRGAGRDVSTDCGAEPGKCHWISLDPSFKLKAYPDSLIDIYSAVPFDYDRYYNAIKNDDADFRDKNPIEIYEEQILNYLAANHPGKTLEDVADQGTIIAVNDGILPASLPYEVVGAVQTFDSIGEHDAVTGLKKWAKFVRLHYYLGNFTFTGGLYGPFIMSSYSDPIALADLSSKKLTLSYFEGNGISGDPFEHHQMTLRLDGQIIDTPILIGYLNDVSGFIGRRFDITLELDGAPATTPDGQDHVIEATYLDFVFGGYYLIGTGGDVSNWSQVHRAADQLLAANAQYPIINNASDVPYVDQNHNGVIDGGEPQLLEDPQAQDALTGGLLYVAMSQYYTKFVEQLRRLGQLQHVIAPIEGFVGVVSSTYDVEYLADVGSRIILTGISSLF